MKILHVIASLDSSYGGPVSILRGIVPALRDRGIRQTIVSTHSISREDDLKNASFFQGVPVNRLSCQVRRYFWSASMVAAIGSQIKANDLVHLHGVFSGITDAALRACRDQNKPLIVEPFGTLSQPCLQKSQWLKKMYLWMDAKKMLERADAFYFTSEGERQKVCSHLNIRHSFIVPNGVDWKELEQEVSAGAFRGTLGLTAQDPLLLFLGRLHPIKGLDMFLGALAHAQLTITQKVYLAVVGPNEAGYQSKLLKLAKKLGLESQVFFVGALSGAKKVQALKDCDLLVLPSYHENFGMVVCEAMACHKPVFVSLGVDLHPVVQEARSGFVSPLKPGEMAKTLLQAFAQRAQWVLMGKKGYDWAKAHCHWAHASSILHEQYQKILKN